METLTSIFEEPSIGSTMQDQKNREIAKERLRYEEENFVRLRETKKEKAERRRREQQAERGLFQSVEELEDFGVIFKETEVEYLGYNPDKL